MASSLSLAVPVVSSLAWTVKCSGRTSFAICLPLDVLGHHRAACASVGELRRCGFAWRAPQRARREAGERVSINIVARDLDVAMLDRVDERRLEVVTDGLPLSSGS